MEFDGEDGDVHLLVNYNSLKGVFSRLIRKKNYPSIRNKLCGRRPTWPVAAAHPSPLSGSTSNSSKALIKNNDKDGFAVRALDPAVNGEVCRATDQIDEAKLEIQDMDRYEAQTLAMLRILAFGSREIEQDRFRDIEDVFAELDGRGLGVTVPLPPDH